MSQSLKSELLSTGVFLDNKYFKWYFNLLADKSKLAVSGQTERHHIVPNSFKIPGWSKRIVNLSPRRHFLAHLLLTKCCKLEFKKRALYAIFCFRMPGRSYLKQSGERRSIRMTSRIYENFRKEMLVLPSAPAQALGTTWWNDGRDCIRLPADAEPPAGWSRGRTKLPSRAGVINITDGKITKRLPVGEQIPTGWRRGIDDGIKHNRMISEKRVPPPTGAGRKWINDGTRNRYLKVNEQVPDGWVMGRLTVGNFNPSVMNGMAERIWITNGEKNSQIKGGMPIPDGWRRGRTR